MSCSAPKNYCRGTQGRRFEWIENARTINSPHESGESDFECFVSDAGTERTPDGAEDDVSEGD